MTDPWDWYVYLWLSFVVDVGKTSIHGASGIGYGLVLWRVYCAYIWMVDFCDGIYCRTGNYTLRPMDPIGTESNHRLFAAVGGDFHVTLFTTAFLTSWEEPWWPLMGRFFWVEMDGGFIYGWIIQGIILRSHPQGPLEGTKRTLHQQFWRNFFRIVGVKGEVWGIFPGYVGKIIELYYAVKEGLYSAIIMIASKQPADNIWSGAGCCLSTGSQRHTY